MTLECSSCHSTYRCLPGKSRSNTYWDHGIVATWNEPCIVAFASRSKSRNLPTCLPSRTRTLRDRWGVFNGGLFSLSSLYLLYADHGLSCNFGELARIRNCSFDSPVPWFVRLSERRSSQVICRVPLIWRGLIQPDGHETLAVRHNFTERQ